MFTHTPSDSLSWESVTRVPLEPRSTPAHLGGSTTELGLPSGPARLRPPSPRFRGSAGTAGTLLSTVSS